MARGISHSVETWALRLLMRKLVARSVSSFIVTLFVVFGILALPRCT